MYKCKKFKIQELVSNQVFKRYGAEFCWKFFDEDILIDLDTIREFHGESITINDWSWGGSLQQCGLRCNLDPMVKGKSTIYCSAHCMGKAFDLHSKNNKKLYQDIQTLFKQGKLRVIKRLESSVSTKFQWVHVDSFQTACKGLEIFTA